MSNIQQMCQNLSNKIITELKLETNEGAIVHYGLFMIIQTSIALLVGIIFGTLAGVLVPSLIFSFAGVILRKYSGGAHAQTPEQCILVGTIVSVGGAWALSKINWNMYRLMILGIIVFATALYLIYKLAPVDSKSKPIKKLEKKQMLKKKSIFVLAIYLFIVMIAFMGYKTSSNKQLLLYIGCIYGGIGWQVFTLTSWGHIAIAKVDDLFNKLLKQRKRRK